MVVVVGGCGGSGGGGRRRRRLHRFKLTRSLTKLTSTFSLL